MCSRNFGDQVGSLEPGAFWPTHSVGYLNGLISLLGLAKCFGNSTVGNVRLSSQNSVSMHSRNFDFHLNDWNQMHFGRHILLAVPSWKFKVLWKLRSRINATVSSEFDVKVASRNFDVQVGRLEPGQHFIFALQQRQQHIL